MKISSKDIDHKKQELGLEPPMPSHGPEHVGNDSLGSLMQSEAAEAERADQAVAKQLPDPAGTNDHNQYRKVGHHT